MKASFRNRRDLIIELLNDLEGVSCAIPSGAFYAFPDFSPYLNRKGNNKLLKDTFDISEYILDSVQVVTVPGDGFGAPGHIRFSYATNRGIIKEGMSRVNKALNEIEE
jgi:Aspartate/tyrosine/aromatic aminotransferase